MQVSSARASGTDKAKSRLSAKMTPESARLPTKAQLPRRDPFVAVKFLRQKRRLDIPDRSGKRQSMSVLEAQFAWRVRVARRPEPHREYRFDAMRRWKFDCAWPNWKIAVECEGGIWTQGRHTRALGFEADGSKYNAATVQGWRVLRFTRSMVQSGAAVELLTQAIQQAAGGANDALFLVEKQEVGNVGNVGKRYASFLRHERSVAKRAVAIQVHAQPSAQSQIQDCHRGKALCTNFLFPALYHAPFSTCRAHVQYHPTLQQSVGIAVLQSGLQVGGHIFLSFKIFSRIPTMGFNFCHFDFLQFLSQFKRGFDVFVLSTFVSACNQYHQRGAFLYK